MNILVIGGGGREHALVWKLKQSPRVQEIHCLPGNAGIAQLATCVDKSVDDFIFIEKYCRNQAIDLIVIGPEVPLIKGLADYLESKNFKVFGPGKQAAQLEGSKAFAKVFMQQNNIPTARFKVFDQARQAMDFLKKPAFDKDATTSPFPLVIKADGLAAGKGVIICANQQEAEKAVDTIMLKKTFGSAGDKIVIEEHLSGEEASILCFTDGETIVPMVPVQDHKRVYDDDNGPNTGGMGCYAPVKKITAQLLATIQKRILFPTLAGLKAEKILYRGVLYVGIMIVNGEPFVLEYNIRFGDPETQVIMPLLKTDLLEIIEQVIAVTLKTQPILWEDKSCVTVVMSSGGYPGGFSKGKELKGLEKANALTDVIVFHAGTAFPSEKTLASLIEYDRSKIITAGGRVLAITGVGQNLPEAIERAYQGVEVISFAGAHFRRDIGKKGI